MIRIIRNDTSDEREELPGCELAGECGNTVFLGLVQSFSLRNSVLPLSREGLKQVCGVREFSSPAARTAAAQQAVSSMGIAQQVNTS